MPVKASAQPLLVEEVSNQTDTSAENEETVEHTHLQVVLSLLVGESTAVADKVNKADRNATVNVEDEVVLLGCRYRLNSKRVVEQLGAGEVLLDVLLDELDTKIGVVAGLDSVANTRDCDMLAIETPHLVTCTYSACSLSSSCQQSHEG